jgi:hypothetical protein
VQVVQARSSVSGCVFIQRVSYESLFGGLAAPALNRAEALSRVVQATANLGGNRILLLDSSATLAGTNVISEAYRCG